MVYHTDIYLGSKAHHYDTLLPHFALYIYTLCTSINVTNSVYISRDGDVSRTAGDLVRLHDYTIFPQIVQPLVIPQFVSAEL